MSNPAQLLNVGREVTLDGTTYTVRELDAEKLFRLSQWLQDRAFAAIDRQPLAEDQKRAQRAELVADIAAGRYDPGADVYAKAVLTPAGAAKGLYLSLCDDHPEVTQERCTAWVQAGVAAAARAAVEAMGDPKAWPPGASAPGGKRSSGSGTKKAARSKKSGGSRRGR